MANSKHTILPVWAPVDGLAYVVERFSKVEPMWQKIAFPVGSIWRGADVYRGPDTAVAALKRWVDCTWDNKALAKTGFKFVKGIPCFGKDSDWCYEAVACQGGEYYALENDLGEVVELYVVRPARAVAGYAAEL